MLDNQYISLLLCIVNIFTLIICLAGLWISIKDNRHSDLVFILCIIATIISNILLIKIIMTTLIALGYLSVNDNDNDNFKMETFCVILLIISIWTFYDNVLNYHGL